VAGGLLLDADGGREVLDPVHIGLVQPPRELPRTGRQALHIAPLALGISVSNARLDVPGPDSPVITTRWLRGGKGRTFHDRGAALRQGLRYNCRGAGATVEKHFWHFSTVVPILIFNNFSQSKPGEESEDAGPIHPYEHFAAQRIQPPDGAQPPGLAAHPT